MAPKKKTENHHTLFVRIDAPLDAAIEKYRVHCDTVIGHGIGVSRSSAVRRLLWKALDAELGIGTKVPR